MMDRAEAVKLAKMYIEQRVVTDEEAVFICDAVIEMTAELEQCNERIAQLEQQVAEARRLIENVWPSTGYARAEWSDSALRFLEATNGVKPVWHGEDE